MYLNIDSSKLNKNITPADIETWDSLTHLNLIATIESEFNIDFEPEEILDVYSSFDVLHSKIESKINQ